MRIHTENFKNNIKSFGRELDSILSYEIEGERTELGGEQLNSVTPSFQSNILKSAMRVLEIDSNVDIPSGTIVNYQLGSRIDEDEFDYINYGDYIVFSSEKQEDTNSFKIICYDFMLKSMVEYKELQGGMFPMTIRDYLVNICDDLGITFANGNETFANYDKEIKEDLYKNLGYTYRDILDELSQVTASTICINDNNQLEIRYINETNDVIDEEFLKDINVNFGEKYGKINSIVLSRAGESDNVYLQDEESIEENGLCELKIIDNQIMNFNDRSDYLPDILEQLDGLEYYINDFSSTGICYYDICDRYGVQIGDTIYSCVMFNDEQVISQGLEENVFTEMPNESETDYTKADKTDRRLNQAFIIVNKQNQTITALTKQVENIEESVEVLRADFDSNIVIVSTDNENRPLSEKTYSIAYNVKYLNQPITLQPTTEDYHVGIETSIDDETINFIVDPQVQIPNLDNKYTFKFVFEDEGTEYQLSKSIVVSLVPQSETSYVESDTEPSETNVLWFDTTTQQLRRYDGEKWEIVNDYSKDVSDIRTDLNTLNEDTQRQIEQLGIDIKATQDTITTEVNQKVGEIEFNFTTLSEKVDNNKQETDDNFNEFKKYIRFQDGDILLGEEGNEYTLRIENDRIVIYYNGNPISNWIEDKFSASQINIGKFSFIPRDNGSLSFRKTGE